LGRDTSFYDGEFGSSSPNSGHFEKNLVFVIMPFSRELEDEYDAVKDECQHLGLRAVRADEGSGSGFIIRDIVNLIERAEFIVCDLTFERPNVYYELGYAHGVGNEAHDILLVARAETALHFDIAPLRVHHYKSLDELRGIVLVNLSRMIRLTRSGN
jgi:hypothetical protein